MQKILLLSVTLFLVACASVPANFGTPSPSSKIGVYLLIDEHPKHEHVGTTIFQNSESSSASNTNFKDRYYQEISNLFNVQDYELALLEPSEMLVEERFSLFSYVSSDIHFKNEVKIIFNQVAEKNSLDFILVVHPLNGPAWVNSSAYVDGYGLYSSCRFGTCIAEALDHVSARFYDVRNQSSLKSMGFRYFQRPTVPEIDLSNGIDSITSEEIDIAASIALEKFMDQFSAMARASAFVE